MKTLYNILIIALICITTKGFGQIIHNDIKINEPLKPTKITEHIGIEKMHPDSVRKLDWSTGAEDDTSGYGSRSDTNHQRLIYFLHGLGGTGNSWKGSYKALENEYDYTGLKPVYNYPGAMNQNSFENASFEAWQAINLQELAFINGDTSIYNSTQVMNENKPYIIGHSQGGLVARDIILRIDSSYGSFNPYKRKFYGGIITFGTPHAGSYFAVNQSDLARLGSEMTAKIGSGLVYKFADSVMGNIDFPFLKGVIAGAATKVSDLLYKLSEDSLIDRMFKLASAANNDPITKQYGPESTYLIDSLNTHSDPSIAKGLFYGEEEDPLIWRMTHFMITEDPGEFTKFNANADDKLMLNMEKIRTKFYNEKINKQINMEHHASRIRLSHVFFIIPPVFGIVRNHHVKMYYRNKDFRDAFSTAEMFLQTANMRYKAILGAIGENSFNKRDTVGWVCKKKIEVTRTIHGETITQVVTVNETIDTNQVCTNTLPANLPYNSPLSQYTLLRVETIPITKLRYTEIPSDGVVLTPSQKAFPGCPDIFKQRMDKKAVKDPISGRVTIIPYKNNVNHMQMRNCTQTEAALRIVFEADGNAMDEYFKVNRK